MSWRRARALVRERWELLSLLGVIGWHRAIGLGAAMVAVTLLPAATAAAVAVLVGRVVGIAAGDGGVGDAVAPLAIVGALLVVDLSSLTLITALRGDAARMVNGAIRHQVRTVVSGPSGIDHLDDPAVRDLATLPVDDVLFMNIGAGAEGQLWLIARFVGAAASTAIVATYSVPLALFILVALLVQRALMRRQYAGRVRSDVARNAPNHRAAAYWSHLLTTPSGAREARLFGFGGWALGRYTESGREAITVITNMLANALPKQWRTFLLTGVAAGAGFVLVTRAAIDGELSIEQLAFVLGGIQGLMAIGGMGLEAFSIETAVTKLEGLRTLRGMLAVPVATEGTVPPDDADRVPEIVFDDVSFRYPGASIDVLAGLDLRLAPGESAALVGENGAGKTTLLKLLCGFYTPTAGRILVDGHDLRDLDPVAWRRRLAVIFQDFVRFELTARENVALARLDRSRGPLDDDVERAAAAAGAQELVASLPRGWETVLSRSYEGGVELSGGQWQRIALARAMYAARVGGRVLVLDEPTASLDVRAETALFDQLLDHAAGLTAVVVSHRFSTVRRAARIVVLADGRVAEDGPHEALLAADGLYARLYRLQAERFTQPAGPGGEEPAWR